MVGDFVCLSAETTLTPPPLRRVEPDRSSLERTDRNDRWPCSRQGVGRLQSLDCRSNHHFEPRGAQEAFQPEASSRGPQPPGRAWFFLDFLPPKSFPLNLYYCSTASSARTAGFCTSAQTVLGPLTPNARATRPRSSIAWSRIGVSSMCAKAAVSLHGIGCVYFVPTPTFSLPAADRTTSQAEGVLFRQVKLLNTPGTVYIADLIFIFGRCETCEGAWCHDCLPEDYADVGEQIPEFQALVRSSP